MVLEMVESLLDYARRTNPRRFQVDHRRVIRTDHAGRTETHSCFNCIVTEMNPKDCDNCMSNPVRIRLKKAGLL